MKKLILLLPIALLFFGCPNNDDKIILEEEEETLTNVTYKVLLFRFIPDTGHNSSRLQYEIEFNNPNNVSVKGFFKITTNIDGQISVVFANKKTARCYQIGANSSCTISFNEEVSFDLGKIASIEFVSAEYLFEK